VVRALGLACVVGTAWALYLIARRVWPDRLVALGAAALYVAYSTRISGIATVTEILLAPFTAAGVLLLLVAAARQRAGRSAAPAWAAAGLSFGIAVWIKYVPAIPAALTGGLLLLAALLRREQGGLARAIGHGALFSVGLLLPTAASIGVYWWAGALETFWHANFGFAGHYVEMEDHPRGVVFQAIRWSTIAGRRSGRSPRPPRRPSCPAACAP
jgi:4-amino-4-deoxy-L-arabinose transferase-like glycosyltransferase